MKKTEKIPYFLEYLEEAAEQENAYAQCVLGEMYADGIIVKKDYTIAMKWFKKAAEHGSPRAQYLCRLFSIAFNLEALLLDSKVFYDDEDEILQFIRWQNPFGELVWGDGVRGIDVKDIPTRTTHRSSTHS